MGHCVSMAVQLSQVTVVNNKTCFSQSLLKFGCLSHFVMGASIGSTINHSQHIGCQSRVKNYSIPVWLYPALLFCKGTDIWASLIQKHHLDRVKLYFKIFAMTWNCPQIWGSENHSKLAKKKKRYNFCLIEVRAMVVAMQQPSPECTAVFTVCIA